MLKIGVLGAGHLGHIHLKLLKNISGIRLIGFYDHHTHRAANIEHELGVKPFSSQSELIEQVDAIDIVTTTSSHFECAAAALMSKKHIFIEKPVTGTLEEAKKLVELSKKFNSVVQIGHVERFNPAFTAALPYITKPLFVDMQRISRFNPRGTDVSVVLDLMIHDIDILLSTVRSPIKRVSATGATVISDTPDIANARIEFENGCIANLTSSRVSLNTIRKARFFQHDTYISVDFFRKKTKIIRLKEVREVSDPSTIIMNPGNGKQARAVVIESAQVKQVNAIQRELSAFAKAIKNNTTPLVTLLDGVNALDVAYQILRKMRHTSELSQN